MSVFSGFVKTWVKLPSSALILQFGVLSLVSWVAGLPSVSDVLSEYFPFFFFWAELFPDLLSCRRVAVSLG